MSDSPNIPWIAHQVIIFTPRKFGITRIVRFKVQYKAPEPLFLKGHGHFQRKIAAAYLCDLMKTIHPRSTFEHTSLQYIVLVMFALLCCLFFVHP